MVNPIIVISVFWKIPFNLIVNNNSVLVAYHFHFRIFYCTQRICHNGEVKKAAVDLWDTTDNTPNAAPTLWEDIDYRDGYRVIPAVITAGTAFGLGELGWWGDKLYKSKLAANVYTPEQYPAGWEAQSA